MLSWGVGSFCPSRKDLSGKNKLGLVSGRSNSVRYRTAETFVVVNSGVFRFARIVSQNSVCLLKAEEGAPIERNRRSP